METDPLDNPADPPTLYIPEWITEHDRDGPIGERVAWRKATAEEIGQVARQFDEVLRSLLTDGCTPIPVRVTYAGTHVVETELHSRGSGHCGHVWERGEPRVHFDTTQPIYLIGTGEMERGELDTGREKVSEDEREVEGE